MYKHSIRHPTKLNEKTVNRKEDMEINNDQATPLFTNKDNCTETCKCNFVARQKEELSGSTRN
jgi:primase-polymerase (primpol)-like protein